MASKIFISYRRDDGAASAAYIRERLVRAFGTQNVFMDVDNLLPGQRFDLELGKALAQCEICVAVMGPRWLQLLSARAASRQPDYVRQEIAGAITRGISVIPVLVDRGTLPPQNQLPSDLRALVLHQKHDISHEHRGRDIEDLVTAIRAIGKSIGKSAGRTPLPWTRIVAGGAAAVLAVGIAVFFGSAEWGFDGGPAQNATGSLSRHTDPALALAGSGVSFHDWSASGQPCPKCPEMVVAPAGNFVMGSPSGEPERDSQQESQIRIVIGQAFAVGKYAVTFDEWDACVADGGCTYRPADEGWGRGRRPVVNVSFNDAKWYVAWLSRKTGKPYRLLSESQREYVTRAGTSTAFSWGASIGPDHANYNASVKYEGGGSIGEYRQKTVPAGSFQPNPWGLYDVHGNVWEWTEDCWSGANEGNPGNGAVRTSRADCDYRVARGGAWNSNPKFLRSASRNRYPADRRGTDVGFRVARSIASQ